MEHVGIVVDDLAAATEFFVQLGLELQGEGQVEGRWVDRIVGLEGVRADTAMMQTPDGHGRLELVKFHTPPAQGDNGHAPANTSGIRDTPAFAQAERGHADKPRAFPHPGVWRFMRRIAGKTRQLRGSHCFRRNRSSCKATLGWAGGAKAIPGTLIYGPRP
jgi:catechol 2,3-dioxygenase-like lactoylglutathione lyase family enzyme